MGMKRVFTKMDLQWEYNNVQVKEDMRELLRGNILKAR